MSTITLTKTYECASGDHLNVAVTGDVTGTVGFYMPDLDDPVTDEETFLMALIKIGKKTRTEAQIKSLLTTGWTITI